MPRTQVKFTDIQILPKMLKSCKERKVLKIKFLTWIQSPFLQVNSSARQVLVQTISSEPSSQSALVGDYHILVSLSIWKRTPVASWCWYSSAPQSTLNEFEPQLDAAHKSPSVQPIHPDWGCPAAADLIWPKYSDWGIKYILRENIIKKIVFFRAWPKKGGGLHMPKFFGPLFYKVIAPTITKYLLRIIYFVCFFGNFCRHNHQNHYCF